MTPVKSALAALAVGLIAYFVAGAFHPPQKESDVALIGTDVAPSLAPGATEVPNRGTKSGTSLAPGAKTVAPGATKLAPALAPSVSPRISTLFSPSPSPTAAVSPRATPTPSHTPTPTPVVPRIHTPTPSPTPLATPTPTPNPTPTDTPSPSATPTSSPTPAPVGTSHVVINEIGWSGTATNSADEWVELYNSGSGAQELNGWTLCDAGGALLSFSALHRIDSGQFFLMERGDDDTISDIAADFAHSFGSGGLNNTGERLTLRSGSCAAGDIIDEVGPGAWAAGSASPDFASMERISAPVAGTDASNWGTNDGSVTTGQDAAGNSIRGTPKYKNSVSH